MLLGGIVCSGPDDLFDGPFVSIAVAGLLNLGKPLVVLVGLFVPLLDTLLYLFDWKKGEGS